MDMQFGIIAYTLLHEHGMTQSLLNISQPTCIGTFELMLGVWYSPCMNAWPQNTHVNIYDEILTLFAMEIIDYCINIIILA